MVIYINKVVIIGKYDVSEAAVFSEWACLFSVNLFLRRERERLKVTQTATDSSVCKKVVMMMLV